MFKLGLKENQKNISLDFPKKSLKTGLERFYRLVKKLNFCEVGRGGGALIFLTLEITSHLYNIPFSMDEWICQSHLENRNINPQSRSRHKFWRILQVPSPKKSSFSRWNISLMFARLLIHLWVNTRQKGPPTSRTPFNNTVWRTLTDTKSLAKRLGRASN